MAFDMEEQFSEECVDSGIHEECGVFGAYDFDGNDIASTVYYGLFALQHRGQESCGIAVSDTNGPKKNIQVHKGMGLVNEVFSSENLEKLKGNISVGHVRYSTAGSSTRENAQPLVLNYYKGTLALAHNGNLVNALELREELEKTGAIFQTTIDSEVIAYHVAKERISSATAEEAVLAAMRKLKGAYSLIVMSPRKLIGARDPFGFRPLCIGKRDNTYFLTSETCALDTVGAEFVRDVEPGEVVTLTPSGIVSNRELCFKDSSKQARCIFEYIYFARPDAVIDGVGVYASRIKAGRFLAMDSPVEADMVVGVPESGNPAAQGYAMESGIPYGTAFIKNSYVGRTFIKPKQSMRESSVQVKLNVLKDAVKGKRIVMIDDSIVRGTTCHRIVRMLKDAGAKEVHVRISSPPFLHPCYFGTDIPSEDQLIAYGKTLDEIRDSIEADTLAYLGMERLKELNNGLPYCDACFSGNYPIEPPTQDIRGDLQSAHQGDAAVGLFQQSVDIVLRQHALPHVDVQVDHVLQQRLQIAVRMVDDDDALVMDIVVNLLILRFDEFAPHLWGEEEAVFRAPVVVGENQIWMHMLDQSLEHPKTIIADGIAQLVHGFLFRQQIDEQVLKAHKEMEPFKHAGVHKGHQKLLIAVHRRNAL